MCTLIALHRCVAGRPLVIAANRDEYLDRPAEGPALREGPSGPFVAPRDLEAGGTWLGVGPARVFVGVTNRPCSERDPERRSRGLLAQDAMAARSALDAARALERLAPGAYNPFNLFVADGRDAFVATYEEEVKVRALEPGVHVVGNADPNDRAVPKVARLLIEAERVREVPEDRVLDALASVCRRHGRTASPFDHTCIHTERYGTRSSALLCLGEGANDELRFADGPPCTTAYRDFTPLLRELGEPRVATGAETETRTES